MTIPNEVREAILKTVRTAEREAHAAFKEGRITLDERNRRFIASGAVRKWLDGQPQARYSHRNGETKPPEVEGWYWVRQPIMSASNEQAFFMVRLTRWHESMNVYWHGEDGEPWPIDIVEGEWYGPIPEPEAES